MTQHAPILSGQYCPERSQRLEGSSATNTQQDTDFNCDRERLLCPARENLLRENDRLRREIADMIASRKYDEEMRRQDEADQRRWAGEGDYRP